ncbi:hypothetical protein IU323_004996 [Escherichia coli]|nr:hypothetical protein [Escherichia coli]EGO6614309.1 hypothetical protein [Escherichia coli]
MFFFVVLRCCFFLFCLFCLWFLFFFWFCFLFLFFLLVFCSVSLVPLGGCDGFCDGGILYKKRRHI